MNLLYAQGQKIIIPTQIQNKYISIYITFEQLINGLTLELEGAFMQQKNKAIYIGPNGPGGGGFLFSEL